MAETGNIATLLRGGINKKRYFVKRLQYIFGIINTSNFFHI